jgi:OOP family OmpA-OmpF porin
MSNAIKTALAAALFISAAAANAQSGDAGWYLGIGAGSSNYSNDIPKQIAKAYSGNASYALADAHTTDDSDTAAQIFVGYKFLPWLAVEIGYQDLGDANTHYDLNPINSPQGVPPSIDGRYRARDVNAVLVASLPIGDRFELLARGGVSDVRLEYDEHGIDVLGNAYVFHGPNDDSTHPQFGIGALWHFSPQFSLRLDLDRNFDVGKKFALHTDTNGRFDNIDAYTLNLIWKP